MRAFEYLAPKSIEEALDVLSKVGNKAMVMAGGTDLIVWMQRHEISPKHVVHLDNLDELRYVREEDGYLRVGALTTQAELAKSRLVGERATALSLAARSCAGPAVRNLATIGGNLGTATPAGDLVLAVAALEGAVRLRSVRGERELTMDEFLLGPQQTALAPDEIIIEVAIPLPDGRHGSGFHKLGKRKAMTISTASAA
ncbi:MAG: FAD binding domain-containing protein, partial [Actinobacteria bacterium]|nr:FAD binding domain-containing protein [Actinomycetota bacterium]